MTLMSIFLLATIATQSLPAGINARQVRQMERSLPYTAVIRSLEARLAALEGGAPATGSNSIQIQNTPGWIYPLPRTMDPVPGTLRAIDMPGAYVPNAAPKPTATSKPKKPAAKKKAG